MTIPKKVLIVEDDPDLLRVMKIALEGHSYNVEVASNGAVGLELVKKECPDLIVLDLLMPVMDGFDFLSEIRKSPVTKHIPVLVLTNYDKSASAESMKGLSVQEYILKTDIHINKIGDIVAKYL